MSNQAITLEEFSEMSEAWDAAPYRAPYEASLRPAGCNCAAGTTIEGGTLVCQECGAAVEN